MRRYGSMMYVLLARMKGITNVTLDFFFIWSEIGPIKTCLASKSQPGLGVYSVQRTW